MVSDDKNGLKILPCLFWNDVVCSYRKDTRSGIMSRCLTCVHYRKFEADMDEADEKMMDEIDEIQRTGVWK